jgi:hypothetical protein
MMRERGFFFGFNWNFLRMVEKLIWGISTWLHYNIIILLLAGNFVAVPNRFLFVVCCASPHTTVIYGRYGGRYTPFFPLYLSLYLL